MPTLTGLDVLLRQGCSAVRGKTIALLCNQASVTCEGLHALDALFEIRRKAGFRIAAVFGPQHGVWGHTQDDMIEWQGYRDARTGLPFHSLYGEVRKPTPAMLEGVEVFVADLQDVGARYYTFTWTLALCIEACAEAGVPVIVLDRPNPIGGAKTEGTVLDPAYASFVGLHPLPMRHGMTLGEVAGYLVRERYPAASLEVVRLQGWNRRQSFRDTGLVWAMPSPNMPTPDTALVYPGMCLLEGTNLSEGRGTTRPFEVFGAPYVDGWKLCAALNALGLPGVLFRPIQFQPCFQKHAGQVCGGGFVHVLEPETFRPVLTAVAILREVVRLYPREFAWRQPPYEYEAERLPFDVLAGNGWLRQAIEGLEPLEAISERFDAECSRFAPSRDAALLYGTGDAPRRRDEAGDNR